MNTVSFFVKNKPTVILRRSKRAFSTSVHVVITQDGSAASKKTKYCDRRCLFRGAKAQLFRTKTERTAGAKRLVC